MGCTIVTREQGVGVFRGVWSTDNHLHLSEQDSLHLRVFHKGTYSI